MHSCLYDSFFNTEILLHVPQLLILLRSLKGCNILNFLKLDKEYSYLDRIQSCQFHEF